MLLVSLLFTIFGVHSRRWWTWQSAARRAINLLVPVGVLVVFALVVFQTRQSLYHCKKIGTQSVGDKACLPCRGVLQITSPLRRFHHAVIERHRSKPDACVRVSALSDCLCVAPSLRSFSEWHRSGLSPIHCPCRTGIGSDAYTAAAPRARVASLDILVARRIPSKSEAPEF